MATAALWSLALGAAHTAALAQIAWPTKPVTLVVPFPPGGATDFLARTVSVKLAEQLGVPVVVTNRPGAGGNIGASSVAKAPADGYTLLMGSIGTQAINASLYAKMPYDAARDFAPISRVAMVPNVLVVHPGVPAQNVQELVSLARAKPGTLAYGSAGNGSSVHLSAELFKTAARVDLQHIPYAGSAPAMTALLGSQVNLMFDNLPSALPHIKAGKLRALAVTSDQRVTVLPTVPTVAESGLPGFAASSWFGLLAPARTAPEVVNKLNAELQQVLSTPAVRTQMAEMGAFAHPETPAQFEAFIAAETKRWAEVVRTAGARVD